MQFDILAVYLAVSIIVTFFISLYAWRHPKTRSARSFSLVCITAILWMIGDVVGRTGTTFETKWVGELVRYLGVVFVPPSMFVFLYHYSGRHTGRKTIYLLCIVPSISWLFVLTNPWHHLFFSQLKMYAAGSLIGEYGYYFWFVHMPYSYSLLLVGFAVALVQASRASSYYRTQIVILFVSIIIPLAVNIISTFELIRDFKYTPLSFPVFFAVMTVAIFRYRLLASNPIAYETVFKNIRDGVIIVDRDNAIMDINPTAAKGLGRLPREIIGQPFEEVFAGWKNVIGKYLEESDLYDEIELDLAGSQRHLSISITPLEGPDERLDGRIFTLRDITDRKQYQLSLETLAFHDPLTRLANRRKFQEEVERAVEKAKETGGRFAVLYFDLNHFKKVNDTMGHETGDELLKYVAARVASILRKPDLLSRLGGDEFAVLLNDCDAGGIELVLERLLENVTRPFQVGRHTLVADLSVGAAFYPDDGESLDELLRCADAEMYRAKQRNRKMFPLGDQIGIAENPTGCIS